MINQYRLMMQVARSLEMAIQYLKKGPPRDRVVSRLARLDQELAAVKERIPEGQDVYDTN